MPPLQPLKEPTQDQPSGYPDHSVQRHTVGKTSNQQEARARLGQAQLVPSNCGKMCTFTKEDIIALRCITTEAMDTHNVFIFAFSLISHGFSRHGCTIRRETHTGTKGISVIIHTLHELSLKARGTQVQISQQRLQICNSALPIQTQTTTCLPEQTFNLTLHSKPRRFWPFLEAGVFIIFGHFGRFRRAVSLFLRFWGNPEQGTKS